MPSPHNWDECLIHPQTTGTAEDGDVGVYLRREQIRIAHVTRIANHRTAGFTRDGLRPALCLAKKAQEIFYRYRFERVGSIVEKYDILDPANPLLVGTYGAPGSVGGVNHNVDGHMYVHEFLAKATATKNHRVFGTPGREFWYGGREDFSESNIDSVWQAIETDTPEREAFCAHAPFTPLECRKLLIRMPLATREQSKVAVEPDIRDGVEFGTCDISQVQAVPGRPGVYRVRVVDIFTMQAKGSVLRDASGARFRIVSQLRRRLLAVYGDSEPSLGVASVIEQTLVRRRRRRVLWRDLGGITVERVSEVLDQRKVSDYRADGFDHCDLTACVEKG